MTTPHQPNAETPVLEEFLRGARVRRLTGPERRAAIHLAFVQAEMQRRAEELDPEAKPSRIMVMWRLVRATAIVKGLCAEDETLDAATEVEPDPWVEPFHPTSSVATSQSPIRKARQTRLLREHSWRDGLPLLPPTDSPAALVRWCNAATIIAKDLGVERSQEGLRGLQGLLDPKVCRNCDVLAEEVLAFEEMILIEALDLMLDHGERATIKQYRDRYGFSHKEATSLLRVVKTQALERSAASIEEKRALMEMRYENMLSRYKETMDMDGELKAAKELSRIQGLTRTEPENQAAEFFQVVKAVAARQDAERLDPATLKMLDGQRAEEVEAITIQPAEADPDDAEALAEYDRENQHG